VQADESIAPEEVEPPAEAEAQKSEVPTAEWTAKEIRAYAADNDIDLRGVGLSKKRLLAAIKKAEPKPKPKPSRGTVKAPSGAASGAAATGGGYGVVSNKKGGDTSGPDRGRRDSLPAEQKSLTEAVADVAAKPFANALDGLLKIVAPAQRGALARQGARVIRKSNAAQAQRKVVLYNEVRNMRRAFWTLSRPDQLGFIDKMETGSKQETPKLEAIASTLRGVLEDKRGDVIALGKGKLANAIENYFPHIWKDAKKAQSAIKSILGKRPLEGSKAFLKKRSIVTVKEGVEQYGLEPVSYNPVDLVLLKVFEMDRYVTAQKLIGELKNVGLVQFLYARSQTPDGFARINDNMFTVFMPPVIETAEAFDQVMVDNLIDFARSIGIDNKRVMKIGGNAWGKSDPATGVTTRFGGPESVLIHEVGHQLGNKYNLYEWMLRKGEGSYETVTRGPNKGSQRFVPSKGAVEHRKTVLKEWRALADARAEGQETTAQFARYLRKQAEKEAVLLEALIHAPEKMKEIAPTVTKLFRKYLADHAELRPLLDIKPSLVIGEGKGKIDVPGITTLGHFIAPDTVANLLNNHLAPGLRGSTNQIVSGGYDMLRQAGNTLNQVQLAMSGFHALFTSISTMASQVGQGVRNLATLRPNLVVRGATQIATAPVAVPLNIYRGRQLMKAYRTPLEKITDPHMRGMVDALIAAGGRGEADAFYFNQASDRLIETVGNIFKGTTGQKVSGALALPIRTAKAAIEATMTPILKWLVPHQKLGMFSTLAQDEIIRLKSADASDEVVWQRMVEVWDSVDNRLGQLVYDNLFWNKTLKDVLMLATRSVGWNLGFLREYAAGPIADIVDTKGRLKRGDALISLRMAELIGTVSTLAVVGAAITYMITGRGPEDDKDYFYPPTGGLNPDGSKERLNLPTYAKDLHGWATRPVRTAKNKLHPVLGLIADMAQNEDFFGTEIRHPDDPVVQQLRDLANHVGKSFQTFSMSNWKKMREAGASKKRAAFTSITGITTAPSYVTKSPAQKLMVRYIVARLPRGTRTKEQFEKSKLRGLITNRMRQGQPIDILEPGKHFTSREIKRMRKRARQGAFETQFKRLTIEEALNVYAVADNEERASVRHLLRAKFKRAHRTARTSRRAEWAAIKDMFNQAMLDAPSGE